jgi:hypothetical protein
MEPFDSQEYKLVFVYCLVEAEEGKDDELMKLVAAPSPTKGAVSRAREDLNLEGQIWSFIRRYPTSSV